MIVYLPDRKAQPNSLVPQFRRIVDLYAAGVLADNAEVWFNPVDGAAQMFWSLTDRSALMYFYEAPVPGYVRIGGGRVRWAPTYDASSADPILDLNLADLTDSTGRGLRVDPRSNFTLIVNSMSSDQTVGIVENQRQEMKGGYYVSSKTGISVIDLQKFLPRVLTLATSSESSWTSDPDVDLSEDRVRMHPQPSRWEEAHAAIQGEALLTAHMTLEERNQFRGRIDEHRVNLPREFLIEAVRTARGVFQGMARGALDRLNVQLAEQDESDEPMPAVQS